RVSILNAPKPRKPVAPGASGGPTAVRRRFGRTLRDWPIVGWLLWDPFTQRGTQPMRTSRFMTAAVLASFAAGAAFAQAAPAITAALPPSQQLTPEMKADSDALRALAA